MPELTETTADGFSNPEFAKVGIDYVKHLTTLASGSIVVIATFMDKFPHSRFKLFMGLAAAAFAISIAMSCLCMLGLIVYGSTPGLRTQSRKLVKFFLMVIVLSFAFGICCLTIFAVLNL